ncbi:MAG: prepilin-type N-terminal cleavage/methylation domain-containing protein [Veillonellales bacterium]
MNNSKGFTLVEIVIGMAIMCIIAAAAFSILSTGVKAYQYDAAQSHIIGQAGPTMSILVDKIRYANSISSLNVGDSTQTLSFVDSSNNVCKITKGTDADINTIIFTEGTSTQKMAIGIVKSITFNRKTIHQLDIELIVHDYGYANNKDKSLTYTVFMPSVTS